MNPSISMPSATVTYPMPCPSEAVFEVLHDYSRRLEWDTLLSEARLTRGCVVAAKGATSLCVGKSRLGRIGIETRYVSYTPSSVAAVEMINHPPWFASFAASIRHVDTPGGSDLIYKFHFSAKPRIFRWILEPVMLFALKTETKRRLQALAAFLERRGTLEPDLEHPPVSTGDDGKDAY